ncbi:ribose-5-phosphate isomerase RpiA [Novosphingobium sp. G106]|nr:ribose-5-phosphate isomerase RpiA [Novosphingobium sp. G106]
MADGIYDPSNVAVLKRGAAHAAVAEIEDGMLVGFGTGTTVSFVIAALDERVAAGLRIDVVATSLRTADQAKAADLRILAFDRLDAVDLAIDGVDELDAHLRAIKGRGGGMLREKIIAAAAARMIVVADESKGVPVLGRGPLPVETLPLAACYASRRIEQLGAIVSLRMAGVVRYLTDQSNVVFDCRFGTINDPKGLALDLADIPGVLGHGLFLDEIDAAYVGRRDGIAQLTRGTSGTVS